MRLESFIFSTIGGILSLCPLPGTAAESGDGEPRRSGWYVGAGVGGNWASDMDQEGWNRETLCYPTDACFDVDPAPEISGYRWHYDIDADAGAAFELSFGRIFGRARLELSLAQRRNDIDQTFRSITYYDGTPEEARSGGSVVSRAKTSIDDLTARILSLNAYYDFPEAYRGMTPYLGIGLGLAFVEVSGVKFSSGYEDSSNPPAAYDPPLSFYASRQSEDLSDTVVVGHLHAGVDYSPQRQHSIGPEADLFDHGRNRRHRPILGSPVSRAEPRLDQPQYVRRCSLLDAHAHAEAPVRQLRFVPAPAPHSQITAWHSSGRQRRVSERTG